MKPYPPPPQPSLFPPVSGTSRTGLHPRLLVLVSEELAQLRFVLLAEILQVEVGDR